MYIGFEKKTTIFRTIKMSIYIYFWNSCILVFSGVIFVVQSSVVGEFFHTLDRKGFQKNWTSLSLVFILHRLQTVKIFSIFNSMGIY